MTEKRKLSLVLFVFGMVGFGDILPPWMKGFREDPPQVGAQAGPPQHEPPTPETTTKEHHRHHHDPGAQEGPPSPEEDHHHQESRPPHHEERPPHHEEGPPSAIKDHHEDGPPQHHDHSDMDPKDGPHPSSSSAINDHQQDPSHLGTEDGPPMSSSSSSTTKSDHEQLDIGAQAGPTTHTTSTNDPHHHDKKPTTTTDKHKANHTTPPPPPPPPADKKPAPNKPPEGGKNDPHHPAPPPPGVGKNPTAPGDINHVPDVHDLPPRPNQPPGRHAQNEPPTEATTSGYPSLPPGSDLGKIGHLGQIGVFSGASPSVDTSHQHFILCLCLAVVMIRWMREQLY